MKLGDNYELVRDYEKGRPGFSYKLWSGIVAFGGVILGSFLGAIGLSVIGGAGGIAMAAVGGVLALGGIIASIVLYLRGVQKNRCDNKKNKEKQEKVNDIVINHFHQTPEKEVEDKKKQSLPSTEDKSKLSDNKYPLNLEDQKKIQEVVKK